MIALDVLRAMQRSPESVEAFLSEVELAAGADRVLDRETVRLRNVLTQSVDEVDARRVVEAMALCWGASLALQHEPAIADAYIRSRLDGDWGQEFGTLSRHVDIATISRRAIPKP